MSRFVTSIPARSMALALTLSAGLLCACTDSSNYVSLKQRDGEVPLDGSLEAGQGRLDGSLRDGSANGSGDGANANMDGSLLDRDASFDLPDGSVILPDGGILLPDGTVIDRETAIMRYGTEVDVAGCSVADDNSWETPVELRDEGGYALVPGKVGFGLAYQAIDSSVGCGRSIDLISLPSSSGFPAPHSVFTGCDVITDVTLLADKDGWHLAWVDNSTNTAELHTIRLDADMNVPKGSVLRTLTSNDRLLERKPILKRIATRPLAAWITRSTTDTYTITTQFLDADATPVEVVAEADGQQPQALALSPIGTMSSALAWVGPVGNPGVWLQTLDENAAAAGAPIRLTAKVGASSSVDLSNRIDGGGAVYSVEIDGMPQIRFRRLNELGELEADERTIVGPPYRADAASLAAIGGGYVVVYRALAGGDVKQPEIRLTFVTKEGNVMRDPAGRALAYKVADSTITSARTYVSVSVEGQIMVAWVDDDPASDKNVLKVARRRLDCQ